jgi:hypothetical protein
MSDNILLNKFWNDFLEQKDTPENQGIDGKGMRGIALSDGPRREIGAQRTVRSGWKKVTGETMARTGRRRFSLAYKVHSESRFALMKGAGSDVHERLYRSLPELN